MIKILKKSETHFNSHFHQAGMRIIIGSTNYDTLQLYVAGKGYVKQKLLIGIALYKLSIVN